ENRVVPPREPAPQVLFRRDHGCTNSRDDQVGEPAAARPFRNHLIPARKLARVPVRVLVDDAPGDQRAAALERSPELFQLLRAQAELELDVLELGRPRVRKVAKQLGILLRALELCPAKRVEQPDDLRRDEQVLAAMHAWNQVPARAELSEPRELCPGPLAEA